jgi:hypothetical protein
MLSLSISMHNHMNTNPYNFRYTILSATQVNKPNQRSPLRPCHCYNGHPTTKLQEQLNQEIFSGGTLGPD